MKDENKNDIDHTTSEDRGPASPGPWSEVLEYLFNVQGITDHGA
jgi:hypothetical protein